MIRAWLERARALSNLRPIEKGMVRTRFHLLEAECKATGARKEAKPSLYAVIVLC